MLFHLLHLRRRIHDVQSGAEDPGAYAQKTLLAKLKHGVTSFIIVSVGILLVLGLAGFSDIFGGPYGFFQVLFVIAGIICIPPLIFFIASYRTLKRTLTNIRTSQQDKTSKTIHVDAQVVDTDYEQ